MSLNVSTDKVKQKEETLVLCINTSISLSYHILQMNSFATVKNENVIGVGFVNSLYPLPLPQQTLFSDRILSPQQKRPLLLFPYLATRVYFPFKNKTKISQGFNP